MTTQSEIAIDTLLQNFLLDAERPAQEVTAALSTIAGDNSFDALGKAVFKAMIQAHAARLETSKATLTAKGPKRSIH